MGLSLFRIRQSSFYLSGIICSQLPDSGQKCALEGSVERFYFNPLLGTCLPFQYDGCFGNDNNFASLNDCFLICSGLQTVQLFLLGLLICYFYTLHFKKFHNLKVKRGFREFRGGGGWHESCVNKNTRLNPKKELYSKTVYF